MIIRGFLVASVVYGVIGLGLGLHMAIGGNHGQMPTHAHLMVLAWLSFFCFGIFYKIFESALANRLAKVHFWLAQISTPVMFIGLGGLYGSNPELEPLAAGGSIVYAISFVIFALVVIRTTSSNQA